jgi:chemotaxis protein CheX
MSPNPEPQSISPIAEHDLRFVAEAAQRYFSTSAALPAEITAAFLGDGAMPAHEFTGVITLTGQFEGQVIVSAPRALLRELLIIQGESTVGDAHLLDAVGEVANTIAGNLRREFGPTLQISVPQCLAGRHDLPARLRARPYVVSLRWSQHSALICVDMQRVN